MRLPGWNMVVGLEDEIAGWDMVGRLEDEIACMVGTLWED